MHTPEVYLLPVPDAAKVRLEPLTHLFEALDHIIKAFNTVARDADYIDPLFHSVADRREQLFHAAASQLAATYPDDEQTEVYDRHVARYARLSAAQQRTATLALYGLASDRATGTGGRDGHTWESAAIAALELYRTHKPDRSIRSISTRSAVSA